MRAEHAVADHIGQRGSARAYGAWAPPPPLAARRYGSGDPVKDLNQSVTGP